MSQPEVTEEQLSLLGELREIAQLLMDECEMGSSVETENDARVAIDNAIDLAERFIRVAKEGPTE